MLKNISALTLALAILLLVASHSPAQIGENVKSGLVAMMKSSYDRTKTTSVRTVTTVEMGPTYDATDWTPYSSWVILNVFPDRTHFAYTLRSHRESVSIGGVTYNKDEDGVWSETKGPTRPITNPSSAIGLSGDGFEFYDESQGGGRIFRVVSNPVPRAKDDENKIARWRYWFDKDGLLYKHEEIGYNGKNWVRTTSVYSYDPTIKVEAPLIPDVQPAAEKVEHRLKVAREAMMSLAYRKTTVVESSNGDEQPARVLSKDIFTFLPPNRYQGAKERYTTVGIVTSEEISIAGKRYTKKGNDPWVAEEGIGGGQGKSFDRYGDPAGKLETTVDERKCEPDRLSGQLMSRCEIGKTYTYTSDNRTTVTKDFETHWFDEKGLLIKSVSRLTRDGSSAVGTTTITYEYDPTIKIEAPSVQ